VRGLSKSALLLWLMACLLGCAEVDEVPLSGEPLTLVTLQRISRSDQGCATISVRNKTSSPLSLYAFEVDLNPDRRDHKYRFQVHNEQRDIAREQTLTLEVDGDVRDLAETFHFSMRFMSLHEKKAPTYHRFGVEESAMACGFNYEFSVVDGVDTGDPLGDGRFLALAGACDRAEDTDCRPLQSRPFSLAVLPDTQVSSFYRPQAFQAETQWLRQNRDLYDIRYVLHEGDVTDRTDYPDNPPAAKDLEWRNAHQLMSELGPELPYALALGNHDYDEFTCSNRSTVHFATFFPVAEAYAWDSFRESYPSGTLENTVHEFSAGGLNWLILALEFGPRQSVIEWANLVLESYPDHNVILLTHSYLHHSGVLQSPKQPLSPSSYFLGVCPEAVTDGSDLWERLLRHHPNVLMVLSGHSFDDLQACNFDGGTARRQDLGDFGNTVFQMLADYQDVEYRYVLGAPCGGVGYMRLLEVDVAKKTLHIRTFSPYCQNQTEQPCQGDLSGEKHEFTLENIDFILP